MTDVAHALLKSLVQAPLLIGDLPHAKSFDRALLQLPQTLSDLNFDQKLGHLYEQALSTVLQASPKIDFLAQNIQIFTQTKQTIGELDFIVRDLKRDAYIHLELGVKFYLAYKTAYGWKFPGPNDRDNWPKKLARLQTHQLRLSERAEARDMLKAKYNIDTIEPRQLVYGCLFIPIDHSGSALRLDYIAKNARTGYWLYAHQWDMFFSAHDQVYFIPKPLWPVQPDKDTEGFYDCYSTTDFIEKFRAKGAMFTTQGLQHAYFLAPDSWPAHILENS